MADRIETLVTIEAAVVEELGAAVRHKGHPWRVGVLATTDGDIADARSVVLREWDEAQRALLIYTDARSPKVEQFSAHPLGTLVLWSETLGWQLRLRVKLELQTAGLTVSSRWARLKMTPAAHDYLSPLPPGAALGHDGPHERHRQAPARESRGHFAVVVARVQSIDWLELHADGHRRARFDSRGARWLAP
ncbi:MAG: pyridoxamine 5'-phosphate oxidase family protein [Rubrivivax sp.]|nr:pyridoxamine 5'-phosphate oxidase family protein [Rubrivivax sp.]